MLQIEQRTIIKFLLAKPCRIYGKTCDVLGEAGFSLKNVYKWAKYGYSTMSPRHGNILTPSAATSKEGDANSLLGHERPHDN